MNACVICGKGHNTSSVVCSQECERRRYPYSHHGPAVYGDKLTDYLISEMHLREDEPELFEHEDRQ